MGLYRDNPTLRSRPAAMPTDAAEGRDRWRRIENGGGEEGPAEKGKVKITTHTNADPPYFYSGKQVKLATGGDPLDPEDYEEVAGGQDFSYNLVSLMELGPIGTGVAPLEVGTIAEFVKDGNYFYLTAWNYKGQYPRT